MTLLLNIVLEDNVSKSSITPLYWVLPSLSVRHHTWYHGEYKAWRIPPPYWITAAVIPLTSSYIFLEGKVSEGSQKDPWCFDTPSIETPLVIFGTLHARQRPWYSTRYGGLQMRQETRVACYGTRSAEWRGTPSHCFLSPSKSANLQLSLHRATDKRRTKYRRSPFLQLRTPQNKRSRTSWRLLSREAT